MALFIFQKQETIFDLESKMMGGYLAKTLIPHEGYTQQ
jgi:hypothetical protein